MKKNLLSAFLIIIIVISSFILIKELTKFTKKKITIITTQFKKNNINETTELVVARYNEDLLWLQQIPFEIKITVYNKGKDNLPIFYPNIKVIKLPNIGREAHTYFYHVITNYHNLADRIIFLQGSPFDHKVNLDLLINGAPTTCKNIVTKYLTNQDCINYSLGYLNHELNNFNWAASTWPNTRLSDQTFLDFAKNINPNFSEKTEISLVWGAQFAIKKENILCHSIDFHQSLYNYFDHNNPIEGHYMERLWNEWANCDNQGLASEKK